MQNVPFVSLQYNLFGNIRAYATFIPVVVAMVALMGRQ